MGLKYCGSTGKESTCNAGDWVRSLGWEDPLEKERLPTPVFQPREFHGLYSPWVTKSQTQLNDFHFGASLVAQRLKRLPGMQETRVRSLSQEDPLEKEMAAHSSTLAWRIPWGRSLVGYSPWGRKESDMTERLHSLTHKSLIEDSII